MRAAKEHGSLSPPKTILNAPTKLMEDEGYGSDYLYDHDQPDAFSGQNYFPDEFKKRPQFYDPPERGFEREIKKRLDYWAKLRAERNRQLIESGIRDRVRWRSHKRTRSLPMLHSIAIADLRPTQMTVGDARGRTEDAKNGARSTSRSPADFSGGT